MRVFQIESGRVLPMKGDILISSPFFRGHDLTRSVVSVSYTHLVEGFVASPYLLEWNDFKLLDDVWGSADTKEYIESSKGYTGKLPIRKAE